MEFLYYLASMLASYLLSSLLRKPPPVPEAATLNDFKFPQATEGTPQCVFFGDCWTGDWMVLGIGNFRTEEIRSEGGKK